LQHAGLNIENFAFASGEDALKRTEIMTRCQQQAAAQAKVDRFAKFTYFGDGVWDARAAADLGWQFFGIGAGQKAEQLRAAGAVHVFEDYDDHRCVLRAMGLGKHLGR
jgi:phosphoglycolate phosphatase-like HAD superfamily hydrolase